MPGAEPEVKSMCNHAQQNIRSGRVDLQHVSGLAATARLPARQGTALSRLRDRIPEPRRIAGKTVHPVNQGCLS